MFTTLCLVYGKEHVGGGGKLSGEDSWHTALYEKVSVWTGQQLTTRTFLGHSQGLCLKNINMIALVFFVLGEGGESCQVRRVGELAYSPL